MKILFVTQHIKNNFGNSLIGSLIRAAEKSGAQTAFRSFVPPQDLFSKALIKGQLFRKVKGLKAYNQDLIAYVKEHRPDLVFVSKGTYLLPDTLQAIKSTSSQTLTACFHPDDPFSENPTNANRLTKGAIPLFDHYFIWSQSILLKLEEIDGPQVHYLPFGFDEDRIIVPEQKLAYQYGISFIGNGDAERQKWVREVAEQLQPAALSVFGNHYPSIPNVSLHPPVYDQSYFDLFRKSKVNINILRKQNKGSNNMRTFEIPAAGGFMLHEHSEEVMEIFRPEQEAVYFSSVEELVDKSVFYLKNDTNREAIAVRGFEKARKGHSYQNRMKKILQTLKISPDQ
jgi:spore maturation protein CgeB